MRYLGISGIFKSFPVPRTSLQEPQSEAFIYGFSASSGMPQETILGNVILFFDKIGIYDVVLPFILVFAIVYAILEKSRILGMVKQGDKEYTNKNVNSLVAFVISFFVIASAQLVEIIAQVSSQVVILLLLSVFFLLLIGSFMATEKEMALEGPLQTFFIGVMLVGIFPLLFYDYYST